MTKIHDNLFLLHVKRATEKFLKLAQVKPCGLYPLHRHQSSYLSCSAFASYTEGPGLESHSGQEFDIL